MKVSLRSGFEKDKTKEDATELHSEGGVVGAYMESLFNIKNISIKRRRENEI